MDGLDPGHRTHSRLRFLPAALLITGGAGQVVLAAKWFSASLNFVPLYGDTPEYLALAKTLRVDQYRTLGYPLVLRALMELSAAIHVNLTVLLYILQTAVSALCIGFLVHALFAVSLQRAPVAKISRPARLAAEVMATVFLVSLPLVNHFNLSILTDSLSLSFLALGLAAVVRIAVLADTRPWVIAVGAGAIAADGFVRSEKAYLFAILLAALIVAVVWPRVRTRIHPQLTGQHVRTVAAALCLLLVSSVAITGLNRATQEPSRDRTALTPATAIFFRTTWPRLTLLRAQLPDVQRLISPEEAQAIDRDSNRLGEAIAVLQKADNGGDRFLWLTTEKALECCWSDIAAATAFDFVKYVFAPVMYAGDLLTDSQTPTAWTYSRMAGPHPALTRIYTLWSFALLALIQVPLLLLWIWRSRRSVHPALLSAASVLVVAAVINAGMYSLVSGIEAHIRYAMPAYLLMQVLVLWANIALVVSLLPQLATRAAIDQTDDAAVKHRLVSVEGAVE